MRDLFEEAKQEISLYSKPLVKGVQLEIVVTFEAKNMIDLMDLEQFLVHIAKLRKEFD